MDLNLVHRGSVKNIMVDKKENSPPRVSNYLFHFSDRYSIFDWGDMPDSIDDKGIGLTNFAYAVFRYLEQKGFKHHLMCRVNEMGRPSEHVHAPFLRVRAFDVLKPILTKEVNGEKYDYSEYQRRPQNTLVPLEVIFRFGIPKGSSLLKRMRENSKVEPNSPFKGLGEGDDLPLEISPYVEFSTKLEPVDRILSYEEAQEIAGLEDDEFSNLLEETKRLGHELKNLFLSLGIKLWDGKVEWAFSSKDEQGHRDFCLVDSLGPDELRLSFENIPLSKECLRSYYEGGEWHCAVLKARSDALKKGTSDWRKFYKEQKNHENDPPLLEREFKNCITDMYRALTNAVYEKVMGSVIFSRAPELSVVAQNFKKAKWEKKHD